MAQVMIERRSRTPLVIAAVVVGAGVAIAATLQRLYPKQFALQKVNTLLNHEKLLEMIRAGKDGRTVRDAWLPETEAFLTRRAAVLMYGAF